MLVFDELYNSVILVVVWLSNKKLNFVQFLP